MNELGALISYLGLGSPSGAVGIIVSEVSKIASDGARGQTCVTAPDPGNSTEAEAQSRPRSDFKVACGFKTQSESRPPPPPPVPKGHIYTLDP